MTNQEYIEDFTNILAANGYESGDVTKNTYVWNDGKDRASEKPDRTTHMIGERDGACYPHKIHGVTVKALNQALASLL